MKNLKGLCLKVLLVLLSLVGLSQYSQAAVDPAYLYVTIYGVAISSAQDCSNPQVIFDNPSGTTVNFLGNPQLGTGAVKQGTYVCVMINMSDVISFVPAASTGTHCVKGTTYYADICRSDNSGSTNLRSGTSFGSATACTGTSTSPIANQVTLYLTTTATGANNFLRPTGSATNGINLASSFVVTDSTSGKFTVNGTGQVSDDGTQCGMNAPTFSFL